MTALADLSASVNRMTGGNSGTPENIFWHKSHRISGTVTAWAAGEIWSLWKFDGHPGAGATPAVTVEVPTNATAGGLKQADPGGGREKWLLQSMAQCGGDVGMIVLYDRLLQISGLSGTVFSPTAQTVGGSLTRYTDGIGNMIMVEIYGQLGTSGTTITASYTDQDDNAGQTTQSVGIGATNYRDPGRAFLLPLASGDTGVKAVASVTLAATTGTAGDFGVTVIHPIAWMPTGEAGSPGWRDFVTGMPGIPKIQTDACLAFLAFMSGAGEGGFFGACSFVEA